MGKMHDVEKTRWVTGICHTVLMTCNRLLIDFEVSGYSLSTVFLSHTARLLSGLIRGSESTF